MQKEIEGEEVKIRGIEDQVLDKMIEAEELQKHVSEAAERLEGEKARVADEHRRLDVLREADVRERSGLLARRKEIVAALTRGVLDLYERIRKARRGVALAAVRDGFCTACHFALRPQLYNEVRTQENLITCENCNRILYYIEPAANGGQAGEDGAQASA
jgi:predicted  nucleic acid-binding Zn-ribbon protein